MKKIMKKIKIRFVALLLAVSFFVTIQAVPVSAKTPVPGNTVTNQCLYQTKLCEYDGKIYFAAFSGIYSVEKDGTDPKEVLRVKKGLYIRKLTVLDDYIYALLGSDMYGNDGQLSRINPDGTGYKIYKGKKFEGWRGLCAVNGKLYYEKNRKIYSMDPDGSDRKLLVKSALGTTKFLFTDGKWIYYSQQRIQDGKAKDTIYRCDMKGKKPVELLTMNFDSSWDFMWEFRISGNYYYYAVDSDFKDTYYRKNRKTNSVKKIYTDTDNNVWAMYVDGKNFYFVNYKTGNLMQLNTATGKSRAVIKKKVTDILGVIDGLMVVTMLTEKTGLINYVLADRLTGKEIAVVTSIQYKIRR